MIKFTGQFGKKFISIQNISNIHITYTIYNIQCTYTKANQYIIVHNTQRSALSTNIEADMPQWSHTLYNM